MFFFVYFKHFYLNALTIYLFYLKNLLLYLNTFIGINFPPVGEHYKSSGNMYI